MVAEHITNLPSGKNSGARAYTLMLVVHSAETPLARGYASSVTSNWLNRPDVEASIHVFAGPETLVRSVNTAMAAWHATWANSLSVGYEQTGYAALNRSQWLTDLGKNMIDRLAREMAEDARIYGIPLRWLSDSEVNAIANGNRSIKGLATHRQIDPINRTDPGDGYPYDVLLASIRKYAGVPTKPQGGDVTTIPSLEDTLAKLDTDDYTNIAKAVWSGPGSWVTNRTTKKREYAETTLGSIEDRVVRQQITPLRGAVAGLQEAVKQLASNQGVAIDMAAVEAAAAAGAARAMTEGVDIEATVNLKGSK